MRVVDQSPGRGWKLGSRRAFTLIEVLVVVAIIALLLAVLLPSLSKAREMAKVNACKANLHDFGLAIQMYISENDPYLPLVPYIGSSIYTDNPPADDNLFVLYLKKMTPNVNSFACPGTTHKVRAPRRVEKVSEAGGIRWNIYCDPASPLPRNDFEFHGQLIAQQVSDPTKRVEYVKGHGTSYEYTGWWTGGGSTIKTKIDWYPFKKQVEYKGQPRTLRNMKFPHSSQLMKDADEGSPYGSPQKSLYYQVVGAADGQATNNIPEPWDNHGAILANTLFGDGHVVSQWRKYWLDIHAK